LESIPGILKRLQIRAQEEFYEGDKPKMDILEEAHPFSAFVLFEFKPFSRQLALQEALSHYTERRKTNREGIGFWRLGGRSKSK
jgi:hypothetical protein